MHVELWDKEDVGTANAEMFANKLRGTRGLAWLDGQTPNTSSETFSFVACEPVQTVQAHWGDLAPLAKLNELTVPPTEHPSKSVFDPSRVPMWIGYIAYDAAWSGKETKHSRNSVPVLSFSKYDALVAIDHKTQLAYLVGDTAETVAKLRSRIEDPQVDMQSGVKIRNVVASGKSQHREAIEHALTHIAAGDIYQVNLARVWTAEMQGDPLALFSSMKQASPVPLGFYLDAGNHQVLARTMETFLRWEHGQLSTRPIKGTIKHEGDEADEARRLIDDKKERAEHAMIVDLMRNDLNRVAKVGSVRVDAPFSVEPYAKLSHLVSTVHCETRPGVSISDVLRATFPPGSVTGAPKIRAVEIIEALESSAREIYCGCVGHITRDGGLSLAVAIRTAVVRHYNDGATVRYHAGGGLVEASQIEKEVEETELKALAFLDAFEVASD